MDGVILGRNYRRIDETNSDDLDNCLVIARSHREQYGTFLFDTIKKLFDNKLLKNIAINDKIYKVVVEIYFNNLEMEKHNNSAMFKETKQYIKCLPTLDTIFNFTNKQSFNLEKNQKNVFFLKLCLDIYENFYKNFDYPLFKKFKNKFLKIVLKFYTTLSNNQLKYIFDQSSITMKNTRCKYFINNP